MQLNLGTYRLISEHYAEQALDSGPRGKYSRPIPGTFSLGPFSVAAEDLETAEGKGEGVYWLRAPKGMVITGKDGKHHTLPAGNYFAIPTV